MSSEGLNWYRRYPRRFLDGVEGMGLEKIGAYAVILELIYARGGSTPRNDAAIAGLIGCSKRKVTPLIDALIGAGKLQLKDGELTNYLASSEAKSRDKLRETRTNLGRKGGVQSGKVRKNKGLSEAKASGLLEAEKKREEYKPPNPLEGEFAEFWKRYPSRSPASNPRKPALKAFIAARKSASFNEIMAGLDRYQFEPPDRQQFNPMGSTWLSQERWAQDDHTPKSTDETKLAAQIRLAEEAIRNGTRFLDSWIAHDVAAGLLDRGISAEELRGAGFNSNMLCGDGGGARSDGGGSDRSGPKGGSGPSQTSGGEAGTGDHGSKFCSDWEGDGGQIVVDHQRQREESRRGFARPKVVTTLRAGKG